MNAPMPPIGARSVSDGAAEPVADAPGSVALSRWPDPRALAALFVLALRQLAHGRRLLVLALLFALPGVLAAAVSLASRTPPEPAALEFAFAFNLIPHALAPLAALLYAAGVIRDEAEEQTLTYLLMRPVPRWALYVVKLAAALLVSCLLTAVFTALTFAVIAATASEPVAEGLLGRALTTAGALALAQVGYGALFGAAGLVTRRALLAGVAYIVLFEGLLASFDTVARRLTVMYYFRVLIVRWLGTEHARAWQLDLATAPEAASCVLVLLSTGLVLTVLAALLFTVREFRMKTPEGG
jgi:ABC-2 type transport system permease protein